MDSATSATASVADNDETDGVTRGLCVVRTWEDERKIRQFGDVSVAWASTVPKADATTKRESETTRTTTSITWNYEIDEGFTYALTVLATNRDNAALPDVADCSSGDAADSPSEVRTDDFPVSHRVSDPAPYRDYQLCARAENDYGASEWAFIGDTVKTRPSAPGAPRYESGESSFETEEYGGQTVTRLVWSVAGSEGTPSASDKYDFAAFHSLEKSVPRSEIQKVCETVNGGSGAVDTGSSLSVVQKLPDPDQGNTNSGIEVEVSSTSNANLLGASPGEYYVYACIRANPEPDATDDDDHGAWSHQQRAELRVWAANPISDEPRRRRYERAIGKGQVELD